MEEHPSCQQTSDYRRTLPWSKPAGLLDMLEQLGVLISTSSPEKDSLLAPMVHEKIAHEILKKEFFFGQPFKYEHLTFDDGEQM